MNNSEKKTEALEQFANMLWENRGKTWKKEGCPKRPLSAYNLFFQEQRRSLLGDWADEYDTGDKSKRKHRKTHGKIGFADMARQIGQKWRQLDEATRKSYEEEATRRKDDYVRAMRDFKLKKSMQEKEMEELTQAVAGALAKKKRKEEKEMKKLKDKREENESDDNSSDAESDVESAEGSRKRPASPRTDTANVLASLGAKVETDDKKSTSPAAGPAMHIPIRPGQVPPAFFQPEAALLAAGPRGMPQVMRPNLVLSQPGVRMAGNMGPPIPCVLPNIRSAHLPPGVAMPPMQQQPLYLLQDGSHAGPAPHMLFQNQRQAQNQQPIVLTMEELQRLRQLQGLPAAASNSDLVPVYLVPRSSLPPGAAYSASPQLSGSVGNSSNMVGLPQFPPSAQQPFVVLDEAQKGVYLNRLEDAHNSAAAAAFYAAQARLAPNLSMEQRLQLILHHQKQQQQQQGAGALF